MDADGLAGSAEGARSGGAERRALRVACLGLLAAAAGLLAHEPPTQAVLSTRTCTDAVLVDGLLRCGEERPQTVRDLCPPAVDARVVQPGDALETSLLCGDHPPETDGSGWNRMPAEDLAALGVVIDLNKATREELVSLPGVGSKRAEDIIAARPFETLDELLAIKGIGPATLDRLRPRVRVDGDPSSPGGR